MSISLYTVACLGYQIATTPSSSSLSLRIEDSLTGEHKEFMDREFSFFREITGISGKIRSVSNKSC